MKRNLDLLFYAGLLGAGLGLAYWASVPQEGVDSERVQWLKIDANAISSISFKSKDGSAEVIRDPKGDGFWISYEGKDGAPPDQIRKEQFRANKTLTEYLKELEPLFVEREVGKPKDLNLEEFGLKEPEAELIISAKDKPVLQLEIGRKSFSSSNVFARDKDRDVVVLLNGRNFDNFKRAPSRLYERDVLGFGFDEIDRVRISSNGKIGEIDRSKRSSSGELIWTAINAKEDKELSSARSWFEQLQKLKVQSYATEEEEKILAPAVSVLKVEFLKDGKVKSEVSLYRGTGTDGSKQVWAKNNTVGRFVKLLESPAETWLKDVNTVIK